MLLQNSPNVDVLLVALAKLCIVNDEHMLELAEYHGRNTKLNKFYCCATKTAYIMRVYVIWLNDVIMKHLLKWFSKWLQYFNGILER